MNKFLLILVLFFLLPVSKLFAVELNTTPSVFENNKEYTLELIATPQSNENAVKLNLIISGAEVISFEIYNNSSWLTATNDCVNNKKFTSTSICTTLVKETPLIENQSLGFIKIRVTDSSKLSIYKIDGTQYSNGVSVREDVKELYKNINLNTNTNITSTPSSEVIYTNIDPIVFYIAIGGLLSLVVIIAFGFIKILKRNNSSTLNI